VVVLLIPLASMVLRVHTVYLAMVTEGWQWYICGHSLVCKNVYYLLATKWLCIVALPLGSVTVLWWDIMLCLDKLYLVRHLCNLTSFCPMSRHNHKLCKGAPQYPRSWIVGCQHMCTYILPLIYIIWCYYQFFHISDPTIQ